MLVTGDGGMLARAFCELFDRLGVPALFRTREQLDITNEDAVEEAIAGRRFSVVVNCAAYTDVDGAESDEATAASVNAAGPGFLAGACRSEGATLLHFSTDYVFGGHAAEPYPVDAPIAPLGAYGRTKAAGERLITGVGGEHLIVRTSWLYAPWGRNFVTTMAKLTGDRDALRVVNDQHGRPTSAEHLAEISWRLLLAGTRGIAHVTDGGFCTWFDLACAVRDGLENECDIQPCTTEEFPRPAPRPAYSVLDLSRTEAVVGAMPGWRENLSRVLPRLEAS
ncbi:MAG: dTDP-4-dehydrorhamnose reductase [Phycisphaerales bacterium]